MTTTEHLSRIRAKCVELLEIASKRTAGWSVEHGAVKDPMAEAGWRATIAAIDMLSIQSEIGTGAGVRQHAINALDAIRTAWPEELL